MTRRADVFEDAFNLLCGEKIGSGAFRDVFECRLDAKLVVKVETDDEWRMFHNPREMQFWSKHRDYKPIANWLAPCEYMSPNGRILLQQRVRPADSRDKLPDMLPAFITDLKPENFGWLDGRLVVLDYAITIDHPSVKLKKVNW